MKNKQPNAFIYAKDVMLFTRKKKRHASKLLALIRATLGKESHQPITIKEFCEYMDLDEEEVRRVIDDN